MSPHDRPALQREVALVDLVDRLLAGGVVLAGELTLSLADVDLLYLFLKVVITPAEEIGMPLRAALEAPSE
ncbi:MAG: hypothetical protein QOE72_3144 [Chloroflexota bacterium]|jgi:hypothetical protein|nr:hypothetical protein [Chloroflexota bacterium]